VSIRDVGLLACKECARQDNLAAFSSLLIGHRSGPYGESKSMRHQRTHRAILTAVLLPTLITGCNFDDDTSTTSSSPFEFAARGGGAAGRIANTPPTLSGTPSGQAALDARYEFAPSANDADGHALEFSINNRPAWATFDARTGRLTGTPTTSDSGVYRDIIIAVTDGRASATLGPFTIAVGTGLANLPGNGSAELSWTPPTQNTDGSPVTNLAGYRIYYGQSPQGLNYSTTLANASSTRHVVTGLQPGTWYFAVAAVSSTGTESDLSEIGSKTIG
jgi:hypothetical protein